MKTVSRHFLRRRARARADYCERNHPEWFYTVVKATRGPFRWYVVRRKRV